MTTPTTVELPVEAMQGELKQVYDFARALQQLNKGMSVTSFK